MNSLIKYNNWNSLLDDVLPSLEGALFTGSTRGFTGSFPNIDVVETKDQYVITADVPGCTEENLDLEVQDGVLTISGTREHIEESNENGYHKMERTYGSFKRSLILPDSLDTDNITANLENGVLKLSIPRLGPNLKESHKIAINSAQTAELKE